MQKTAAKSYYLRMRILGIDIQGSDVIAVILDSAQGNVIIEKVEPTRLPLPQVGPEEGDNLLLFQNQLTTTISAAKVDCVAVVKAAGGAYSASPIKAKIECLVQLAAKRNKLPCEQVAPQTASKLEKRPPKGSGSIQNTISGFQPKYAQRAAYCAWSALNARR